MDEAHIRKQEETREKLLREARKIRSILPNKTLGEIYTYLELYLDDPNRVQRVTYLFLSELEKNKQYQTEETNLDRMNTADIDSLTRKRRLDHIQPCGSEVHDSQISPKKSKVKNTEWNSLSSNMNTLQSSLAVDDNVTAVSDSNTLDFNFLTSLDEAQENFKSYVPVLSCMQGALTNKNFPADQLLDTHTNMHENKAIMSMHLEPVNGDNSLSKQPTDLMSRSLHVEPNIGMEAPVDLTAPGPSGINKQASIDTDIEIIDVVEVDETTTTKYYLKLKEIFPDAENGFLRNICSDYTKEERWLEKTIQTMVENDYPKTSNSTNYEDDERHDAVEELTVNSNTDPLKEAIESNYQILLEILPNADPSFLRENAERIGDSEEQVKVFVSEALEKKCYPTREEYEKRIKALQLREKYIKNFKVEEFLEIFPDPLEYFYSKKNSPDDTLCLNYLKHRYRKIRVPLLQQYFKKNDYNLSKTCQALDTCKIFMKTKRCEHEIKCSIEDLKNVPFLQEVAFIENFHSIKSYLDDRKMKKKLAFEIAKEKNELLECGCCYDSEVMAEDTVSCDDGHVFCKMCLQKYAEVQIGEGKTDFQCLTACTAEFNLKTLQRVLKPSVFSRMLQRKQIEEVKAARIPGLESCPFCDFASIPPEEDKVFRCLNPECMRESCRNCKEPNHIPLRCEEVEKSAEVKMRTYIEDRMTEALVRKCWKCQKKFIKADGCNKMICTCGARMCYICQKPITGYSHFNGQGGTEYDKCPLFSTNDELHVKAVAAEATKAKNEALSNNPGLQLKHDPTRLLQREVNSSKNNRVGANTNPFDIPLPRFLYGQLMFGLNDVILLNHYRQQRLIPADHPAQPILHAPVAAVPIAHVNPLPHIYQVVPAVQENLPTVIPLPPPAPASFPAPQDFSLPPTS